MMNIKQFLEKYPVGSTARYYSVKAIDKFKTVEILSEPWELGHGEIVVKVSGVRGSVSINHIELST